MRKPAERGLLSGNARAAASAVRNGKTAETNLHGEGRLHFMLTSSSHPHILVHHPYNPALCDVIPGQTTFEFNIRFAGAQATKSTHYNDQMEILDFPSLTGSLPLVTVTSHQLSPMTGTFNPAPGMAG